MNARPDPASDVRALLTQGTQALAPGETARLDAELLLAAALGVGRAALYAAPERAVDARIAARFHATIARRARGEPVAYLTGEREFWTLTLAVDARVLVPRPETELLVELALEAQPADADCTVVDLGTGSGAVALALAQSRPRWQIVAVDRSADALVVARGNARRLGLARVEFAEGDWFAPLGARRFDCVVSNPPYVAAADPLLAAPGLAHEPRAALDGGRDGLEALRRIVAGAPAHLRPGGTLLVEHGSDQGAAVRALFAAHGFSGIDTARDLAGHERVTRARHPAGGGPG